MSRSTTTRRVWMPGLAVLYGLITVAPVTVAPVQAKPRADARVKRVYVTSVRCEHKDCWSKGKHGNLHIVYRNGRDVKVTSKGTASDDAQISPDDRTVGWTRGEHKPCTDWSVGGTMFVNSKLVLYRNGKVLHVLEVPGTFIESWRFWNGGKYVAVGSRWHHGMGYCRLFDVATGKLLQRISTPDANSKGLKWAEGLTV